MWKLLSTFISSLATATAASFLMEPWFPPGDLRWLWVAAVAQIPLLIAYRKEILEIFLRFKHTKPGEKHEVDAGSVNWRFEIAEPKVTLIRPPFYKRMIRKIRKVIRV